MRGKLLTVAVPCFGSLMLAAAASASPFTAPMPAAPVHGQPCDDFGKLAYDSSVGQIVCDGSMWALSVEPTGIRDFGAPCPQSEMDTLLASSPDGYLIWCPSSEGVWTVYSP